MRPDGVSSEGDQGLEGAAEWMEWEWEKFGIVKYPGSSTQLPLYIYIYTHTGWRKKNACFFQIIVTLFIFNIKKLC